MADVSIEFDNPYAVFVPGYEVTGTAVLSVSEPVKANSVIISVHGEAHTHWTEQEPRSRTVTRTDAQGHSHTHSETYYESVHYSACTPYANGSAIVWTPQAGQSVGHIQPGMHRFPFRFQLPINCPVSFEGGYGYIRYYCKAKIDRPWYKMDKSTKRVFSVIPPSDLNQIPNTHLPVQASEVKDTGILFFKKGKISVTLRMPKGGYVPGEAIYIEADVVNGSTQKIKEIRTKLVQCSHYIAFRGSETVMPGTISGRHSHRKSDRREVFRSEEKLEIAKGATEKVTRLMPIPAVVATFNNCPIITVEYYLQMKLVTSGAMSTNISVQLPVIIGTIPISQVIIPTTGPTQPGYPSQPPPMYPDISSPTPSGPPAPPSYAQCVLGAGKVKDQDENEAFTPLYPLYPPSVTPTAPPMEKM